MFDGDALRKAWSRDGAAADDRPAEVDELLSPQETTGYEEGLPLLNREFSDYPSNEDLLRPAARQPLATLVAHELITSIEDVTRELGARTETVEKALALHDIEEPSGFDVDVDSSRLDALMGQIPDRMKNHDNQLVVAALYIDKGLSIEEIRQVMDEAMAETTTVPESDVRQALVDAKLIEGETSAEAQRRQKQSRGEVNRTGSSRGMSINSEDY